MLSYLNRGWADLGRQLWLIMFGRKGYARCTHAQRQKSAVYVNPLSQHEFQTSGPGVQDIPPQAWKRAAFGIPTDPDGLPGIARVLGAEMPPEPKSRRINAKELPASTSKWRAGTMAWFWS